MCSNTGYAWDAVKKAKRVGIAMASALQAKDAMVKVGVHSEVGAGHRPAARCTPLVVPLAPTGREARASRERAAHDT
jgi:hypothetical protein